MRTLHMVIFAMHLALCSLAGATQSMDAIRKVGDDTLPLQMDLAMSQKKFSIMSRAMTQTENCAARELLDASISFRQDVEEARLLGRIVGEMKSIEDQNLLRHHLAVATRRVLGTGENDIQLVNDLMIRIATPEAIAEAEVMRDKMLEIREIYKAFDLTSSPGNDH